MRLFGRTAHALLLGALVGCAEGPSGDVESLLGDDSYAQGSPQKTDAGWRVPATSEGGSSPSGSQTVTITNAAAPSVDAAICGSPAANVATGDGGLDSSHLDASAGDARVASSDLDSSAEGSNTTAADSASARTDAGVADVPDSSAICSPSRCDNRCGLLTRCCDTHNQCACEDPRTRLCLPVSF